MTTEEIVEKHYQELFDELIDVIGDDTYEILIEVKTYGGLTVRKSWRDREKNLSDTEV